MNSTTGTRIRVATLDCRHAGGVAGLGRSKLDTVVAAIDALGPAPQVLALTGTIGLRLFSDAPLLALTQRLNDLLSDGDHYHPFLSERPGTRNPPGLWLSAQHLDVVADHHHTVEAFIGGVRLWLKTVQWQHCDSSKEAFAQSSMDSQLATVPAILLGSFITSADLGDMPDVDRAETRFNIDAFQRLLDTGFWDAARAEADLNPPVDAPGKPSIAHIVISHQTPARLVPGSYITGIHPDRAGSAGAACDLELHPLAQQRPA
ncbi:MAG TPA: hypothetical protein VGX25_07545 [Actinophytocola sp.]|uniref:hypothetical protein n=1 Tax=Actinophytocola sp. TaxID=1872138 RepID=UPI002DDCF92A|nr:hypothetical protein [Actinophytocola sp.]HEV2779240.1 hypothetical protein [Actinophytocola sp.]